MKKQVATEIGIKYKVINLNNNDFFLIPMSVVEGYGVGNTFYSDQIYCVPETQKDLITNDSVVDSICEVNDLPLIYDYNDIDFLKEYYFSEEQEYFWYFQIIGDKITRHKIKTSVLKSKNFQETYQMIQGEPAIILNFDSLTTLLMSNNLADIRTKLNSLKQSLKFFAEINDRDAVSKVFVENGLISKIESEARIIDIPSVVTSQITEQSHKDSDISVKGLEKFISERVFGHQEEIRLLATKMIMNFNSTSEFGTEPILIVGPTGTGKTETIKAASEYLNVPFIEINTPDLVPQGIRGASLESYLNSLKSLCNGDLKKAERAFVYLDEFDKLGKSDLDIKTAVKEILLKFIEGGTFIIDERTGSYLFNTTMLNKICAGAFSELFEESKSIGFMASSTSQKKFNHRKIYEGEYYSKELVTRIPYVIPYYSLSREDQKRVILYSKISKYLQKKNRYKKEFGIDLIFEDDFISGILDKLAQNDQSMRDLNNLILEYLALPEYEILSNPHSYKKLVLTRDTVDNPTHFNLL